MGIGEKKTPEAFMRSCEVFTFSENLLEEDEQVNETINAKKENRAKHVRQKKSLSTEDARTIHKAYLISVNDGDGDIAYISQIGKNIKKIDPSFDIRTYGFSSMKKLFEGLADYQVIKNEVNGLDYPLIKMKGQ